MSARGRQPVFGVDEPGSRRLPLAPRSRSVGSRAPTTAEDGHSPEAAPEEPAASVAALPSAPADASAVGAGAVDSRAEEALAGSAKAPQTPRRLPARLTLEVGQHEMSQLVRGGKANQVRSSALATRVLEDAVVALKQRGHGDASKQSVQEMLLLALRGLNPDALVGLHKQYRALLQDAREAEAASQLG